MSWFMNFNLWSLWHCYVESHFKNCKISFLFEEPHFDLNIIYEYLTWSLWVPYYDACINIVLIVFFINEALDLT